MRITFTDDDKGVLGVVATDVWLVSSRRAIGEKAENYTTIEIARTEAGYVVAKESRYQGGPVRRLWKLLGSPANVRRSPPICSEPASGATRPRRPSDQHNRGHADRCRPSA